MQHKSAICSCAENMAKPSHLREWREPLYDARGIFVCYVCSGCYNRKKNRYRQDIFTDCKYWTDEPVDCE